MSDWYQQEVTQVLETLQSHEQIGLTEAEAQRRRVQHGSNELTTQAGKSPWLMLVEQFTSTTVLVLIVAGVVTFLLGEYTDAIAIFAVVLFNAILGFVQEYRASKAFAALRQLAIPKARVWRDRQLQQIDARDLVPGDVIQLEDGDQVPADGRLLESKNLRAQEAAFTGESEPVEKHIAPIAEQNIALADRENTVFMGTVITYGRGRAVVTETGMDTELGHIASSMQQIEQEQTPLQKRLNQLGQRLAIIAILLVAIIFGFGVIRGEGITEMFLTAVSLAVAIIPEGLPAVVTIALAIGARRMLKRQALIRKLPAVETLGSVTTICSDKTGTLTENRMTVMILDLAGKRVELRESYAEITSRLDGHRSVFQAGSGSEMELPLALTMMGSALCNNAIVVDPESTNGHTAPKTLGDPTEIALVVAADRLGLDKDELELMFPRVAEVPFDSDRKRMTTIHRLDQVDWSTPIARQIKSLKLLAHKPYIAFTKGAMDGLLPIATQVWHEHHAEPVDNAARERVYQKNDQLAASGMRVLGVGFRLLDQFPAPGQEAGVEQDLTLVGLVGMLDPARPEAKRAVQICQQAGIRTIMITGDHPLMAKQIAEELEISRNGKVLTGQQLHELTPEALSQRVQEVSVYARVSPEQKLMIVDSLQKQGQIVAMTGDGVNDAPALSKADIGVAMGITGTDVAKEAADMVLLNDNFATIVAATEEGRIIYDNIRKFIRYTLTGNTSTVILMLLAPLFLLPQPLRPAQILWINLLADGLLALALSVEKGESTVMRRPPYPPNESVFSRGVGRDILLVGSLIGLALLGLAYGSRSVGWSNWQTMTFASLAFTRICLAISMRSERELIVHRGILTNKPMLLAILLTLGLQLLVIYTPWLQSIFQTQPLNLTELLICLDVGTLGFWIVEAQKLLLGRRRAG